MIRCHSPDGLTSQGTIPGHPELPPERAAEIKVLAKGDPVPLDLLVRSNLVQRELTRLGTNKKALLNKTVSVAPDVMQELRDLLDPVERQDHEWMETMQRLTITEKTEKRPVAILSRDVERDCRSVVNQLGNSIPNDILFRTSYVERQQLASTQSAQGVSVKLKPCMARRVQFTDAKKEYRPCSDCSSGDEKLSGESNQENGRDAELSGESCYIGPSQDDLSGESMQGQPKDRILSGESRNMKNNTEGDCVDSISSSDGSNSQSWENVSETNSNSDAKESDSFLASGMKTTRVGQRNASRPRQGQVYLR